MSRFRQADDHTIPFSEIKPERFDRIALNEGQRAERRRIFMEEIPLPEEIDRPRQIKGNK